MDHRLRERPLYVPEIPPFALNLVLSNSIDFLLSFLPMKSWLLLILTASYLLFGCNQPTQTTTVTLDTLGFEWSAPLMEGSNPAQVTVSVNPQELLGDLWKEGMKIQKVVLKKAEISAENNADFADVQSLVLSMASNNPQLHMQEIASASPVQPAYNKASLTPATQSKIDQFFGEKEFYMVLDASLKGDRDQDLRLTGQFTLEITFR
jgi:hypothetical protein